METTQSKTQRLLLILEGVALLTALILILVDYKLKNDLVELYRKVEVALERGQKLFGSDADTGSDPGDIRPGALVDSNPTVETTIDPGASGIASQANGNGKPPAKRSGRNRGTAVSDADKHVGP